MTPNQIGNQVIFKDGTSCIINEENRSLWSLTRDRQLLLSQLVDYETGEINQEIDDKLTTLDGSIEIKCTNTALFIKQIESEKNSITDAIKQLEERREAYLDKMEKLERYLFNCMKMNNLTELRTPLITTKIKINPYSTDILDETVIPSQYMVTPPPKVQSPKPDKNLIKAHVIETGVQVPGAYVSKKEVLQLLTDKI